MKSRLLVLLLVVLWHWPALVVADEVRWEQYSNAGVAAYQRGDYEEALGQTKPAFTEAEYFDERDPRFAATLNNLAALYDTQGRYDEAEPLYQRSLAIFEKALGPEHPNTATTLDNLAKLYQAQGRNEDAEHLLREHGQ